MVFSDDMLVFRCLTVASAAYGLPQLVCSDAWGTAALPRSIVAIYDVRCFCAEGEQLCGGLPSAAKPSRARRCAKSEMAALTEATVALQAVKLDGFALADQPKKLRDDDKLGLLLSLKTAALQYASDDCETTTQLSERP